ncbi:8-oxo-dGTP diphosphatase [Polystyrenella longa]|uniref:8-oxo-dGTP diphosphatase n=1 Tax=Polystyrenella longa TaxID=2528007 RepID=A0A518CH66_9PLAN|nr:NUDIX domain-containing protein [Polystyrenella longa]QDU78514.1 8-oxo-dGTP diphosphatase [Polystyrenella longa]
MSNEMKLPKRIGIAIVEHDGKYLIGVRQATQTLAGKAEFPGGKCLPEESAADCAVRECQEETGLDVRVQKMIYEIEHRYSHDVVALQFWLCELIDTDKADSLAPFVWRSREELTELDFPDANGPVIQLLLETESA